MTPKEARARVERLRAMAGDSEIAHGEEDYFRRDVLQAIADGTHPGGHRGAVELAREALSTSEIKFGRWTA